MEQKYQETYFGSNEEILSIARNLIFVFSDKKLLGELGEAVNVLGTSDADPMAAKI
jgi:hypothetical protein